MGFFLSLTLAALCLGLALTAGASAAPAGHGLPSGLQADVCGPISTDDTWTADQGPVNVTCDTALRPGVTLNIEPGVEVRFTAGVSLTISGTLQAIGLPSQPITFTSDLEVPAPGDWSGLHFVAGSSDSSLTGFVVEYATAGVVVLARPGDTVSPAFTDCIVRHNSMRGIQIEGVAKGCVQGLAQPTITGCLVEHNGGEGDHGCGIYGYGHGHPNAACDVFTAGSVGGTVSGSEIGRNHASGICLHAQPEREGVDHGDAWTGIEANVIWGNGEHGLHLYGDDPVRPRIENNLIYSNTGAGIQTDAKHGETDLFAINNTVYYNGGHGIAFNRSALLARLTNNIVADNGGYGLVCGTDEHPLAFHNDLWLNAAGNYSVCTPAETDISADPLLLDPPAGDFRLDFGSPCIDAGTSTDAPATDFDGITRPQGGGVDIGAHEQGLWRTYLPITLRQ
jgi:hypothetical protein